MTVLLYCTQQSDVTKEVMVDMIKGVHDTSLNHMAIKDTLLFADVDFAKIRMCKRFVTAYALRFPFLYF